MKQTLFFLFVLLSVNLIYSSTIYVNESNGNDAANCGNNENNACQSINYVVDNILQDNDVISLSGGVFKGEANVPFTLNKANLTITTTDKSIIDCSGVQYKCVEIIPTGSYLHIDGLTFKNFNATGNFDEIPQALIVIQKDERPFHTTKGTLFSVNNCNFENNNIFNITNQNFAPGAIFGQSGQHRDSLLSIQNSFFYYNSIAVVASFESSVSISGCEIHKNVVGNGFAQVLSNFVHPWRGGSLTQILNTKIYDNHFFSSADGNSEVPLITLGGIRCWEDSCTPATIKGSYFHNNNAPNDVLLFDGAGLQITNTKFEEEENIATIATGNNLESSIVEIDNSQFVNITPIGLGSIIYGRFTTSRIYNSTLDSKFSNILVNLQNDCSFDIQDSEFIAGKAQTGIARGYGRQTISVTGSTFEGGSFIDIHNEEKQVTVSASLRNNTITADSDSSASLIIAGGTSTLVLDGNVFSGNKDINFIVCEGEDDGADGIVALVGESNTLPNNNKNLYSADGRACQVLCNEDNISNCDGSLVLAGGSSSSSGGGYSTGSFVTVLVLGIVYTFIGIIVLFVVIALYFVQYRKKNAYETL